MAYLLLKSRLAMELPRISRALDRAEKTLPPAVQPVAHHIFAAGGKRLRPFLTVLTARLLGYREEDCYDLACTLEMLHAATLLHDDIIDMAPVRRGRPAAHTVFSPTETILAGDALLAEGNALVAGFGDTALSLCYARATSATCAGEIAEIAAQRDPSVSYETYLEIICGKTARLISAACEMGAMLAAAPEPVVRAAAEYGENIGIAFQLVDDALDFAPESVTGKPCGGDIREGKVTLPVRWYREHLSEEQRGDFDKAFRNGTLQEDEISEIIRTVQRLGFDQKTRDEADGFLQKACDALNRLPDASEKKLLHEMTEYVRDRKK